jgi:glycosyltransferase involved in cell wall biosynthesis
MYSVVIPLYNKAPYIQRAISSVLNQSLQDFEIIVVNDGSTDSSREVVETINDPRLILINQPNQGVSVARNNGVTEANNQFIAFLDADDEWAPEYLQNISTLINNFPNCGAYATSVKTIRPDGSVYYPALSSVPPEPWLGILPNFFELFQVSLSAFIPSSIVVPKHVLVETGGFPAGVVVFEDIYCWVNIALRYPFAFNPKRLVIYHQDATNRSNVHKVLHEAPFVPLILQAVKDGLLTGEMMNEALEFVAQRQILTAAENIMAGHPRYAKELLSSCKNTTKYNKLWHWWRLWATFPPGWPEAFSRFKQTLTKG